MGGLHSESHLLFAHLLEAMALVSGTVFEIEITV
jgi:hypothetical protein